MTLLVGILCKDGAVVAADRQATHGANGMSTVGVPLTKVRIVGDNVLFASSGYLGLSQQLASIIERKRPEIISQKYESMIGKLQKDFRDTIEPSMRMAAISSQLMGRADAMSEAICHSILVAPFKDGLKVVEVTPQAGVEYLTQENPFISLGSGKGSADPFLAFLKKVFWPRSQPTLQEGALAAFWTIKHAIDTKVIGVGFDVDVFTIEESAGKAFKAKKIDQAEVDIHSGFIKAAEEKLFSLRSGVSASSAVDEADDDAPPLNQADSAPQAGAA